MPQSTKSYSTDLAHWSYFRILQNSGSRESSTPPKLPAGWQLDLRGGKRTILQRIDAVENSWFLSGLLIGTELEDLVKHTPLDRILVFAPATIALLYDIALNVLDARVEITLVPEDLRERTAVLGHASWLKQTILGRLN